MNTLPSTMQGKVSEMKQSASELEDHTFEEEVRVQRLVSYWTGALIRCL
jgi:uncharacterized protein YukE